MKRASIILLVIVSLFGFVSMALAQSEDGDTLAEFDFDNERIPRELEVTDGWEVQQIRRDTVLHADKTDQVQLIYLPDGSEWEDYAFEVRVRLMEGSIGFNTRIPDPSNICGGYSTGFLTDSDSVNLFALADDCDVTEMGSDTFRFPLGDWVTVRVEAIGEEITVYIDGEQILSGTDDTYSQGFPLILLFSESEADIDYIKVVEIAGASLPLPNANSGKGGDLRDFAGTPDEVIAELEDNDLIPSGGTLLFEEDNAFFSGQGNFFTPLARRSNRTNVVMAAELSFEVGSRTDLEFCRLLLRVNTDSQGTTTTSLNVGVTNEGNVVIVDFARAGQDATTLEFSEVVIDLGEPHHFLIIALDDEASVYVDGQLVFDRIEVDGRDGTYGIALTGAGRDARCEGNNIWVYDLD